MEKKSKNQITLVSPPNLRFCDENVSTIVFYWPRQIKLNGSLRGKRGGTAQNSVVEFDEKINRNFQFSLYFFVNTIHSVFGFSIDFEYKK